MRKVMEVEREDLLEEGISQLEKIHNWFGVAKNNIQKKSSLIELAKEGATNSEIERLNTEKEKDLLLLMSYEQRQKFIKNCLHDIRIFLRAISNERSAETVRCLMLLVKMSIQQEEMLYGSYYKIFSNITPLEFLVAGLYKAQTDFLLREDGEKSANH